MKTPRKWIWNGEVVEPPRYTTKDEVEKMIDKSMKKHNRRSLLITILLGSIVLIGYVVMFGGI